MRAPVDCCPRGGSGAGGDRGRRRGAATAVAGARRHRRRNRQRALRRQLPVRPARRRLSGRRCTVAVSALLVAWRGGAVLPAVARVDHRHRLACRAGGPARRARRSSPGRAVCGGARAGGRRVVLDLARWTHSLPSWAFFSLPSRAWELAVGGLVALTASQWRHLPGPSAAVVGWGGLALIVVTCTQVGETTPYPGTAALLPVLGAALVVGAGCAAPDLGVGQFLSAPAMRSVGRLSYSWYLWHWPVLLLAPALFGAPLGLPGRLAMVIVSFGLAILTLHLVENPARFAPMFRLSAARSLTLGGVVTAAAVCVGLVLLMLRPVPGRRWGGGSASSCCDRRLPLHHKNYRSRNNFEPRSRLRLICVRCRRICLRRWTRSGKPQVFVNGCVRSWRDVGQPECASGDTASSTTVALVGIRMRRCGSPRLNRLRSNGIGGWRR